MSSGKEEASPWRSWVMSVEWRAKEPAVLDIDTRVSRKHASSDLLYRY
jgi:hypothetical protein